MRSRTTKFIWAAQQSPLSPQAESGDLLEFITLNVRVHMSWHSDGNLPEYLHDSAGYSGVCLQRNTDIHDMLVRSVQRWIPL